MSSMVLDYCARQKVGGTTLNFFIVQQIACPSPAEFQARARWAPQSVAAWVRERLVELVTTSDDMRDVVSGIAPADPFVWDPGRRAQIRAELDAAFFHMFGLDRADTEHVLSTFTVANSVDRDLTPRILREYDALRRAIDTGVPYESPLDPLPGEGRRHASAN